MAGSYVTAYSYHDNNPPGSAAISNPVIHRQAGGKGTFADPITVAVANGSNGGLQFAAGTKFYVPNLRAYLIAEDKIGGSSGSRVHLDVWAGGQSSSESSADSCMSRVTGNYLVIRNPASNYAVVPGPLAANNTCRQLFGDAVVTSGGAAVPTPPQPAPQQPAPQLPDPPVVTPVQPSAPSTPSAVDGSSHSDGGSRHHHRRHHARWSSAQFCRR